MVSRKILIRECKNYTVIFCFSSFSFVAGRPIVLFRRRGMENLIAGGECIIPRLWGGGRLPSRRLSRWGMKMCLAWSAVRKTSNIIIDGPAAPTFVDIRPTYEIFFG